MPLAAGDVNAMFDADVLAELRRQFDSADTDGNGSLDADEACNLIARSCSSPGDTDEMIRRTSSGLMNQMDSDRSATISFEEYCFRFGRKYQMEAARRKRSGASNGDSQSLADEAARKLEMEREALRAEREALEREREEVKRQREGTSSGTSEFAPGMRVSIQGLQGAPELNGKIATIVRFDQSKGRYVVEVEGGGTQRSLKPDNLCKITASNGASSGSTGSAPRSAASAPRSAASSSGPSWVDRAKDGAKKVWFNLQWSVAGYEWWQIALMIGFVALVVGAYIENRAKYAGDIGGVRKSPTSQYDARARDNFDERAGFEESSRTSSYADDDLRSDTGYDRRGGRHDDTDFRDEEREERRQQPRDRNQRQRRHYDDQDDHYSGGSSGGGGGLLSGMGQTQLMIIAMGFGFLCWKGIIPVQNMSWFQMMMIWNMVEPLLFGGRGRRRGGGMMGGMMGGMGGMGMGRRGFF